MKTIKQSETIPGDAVTLPLSVTLSESHKPGEFCTHQASNGGTTKFGGRYFNDIESATADYYARCSDLGVKG